MMVLTMMMATLFSNDATISASALNKKTLKVGQKWTLTITGTKQKIKWKSSNSKILSIKKISGKKNKTCVLIAKKKGTTKVTAQYGNKKKVITVTVKKTQHKNTRTNVKATTKVSSETSQREKSEENDTEKNASALTISQDSVVLDVNESKNISLKVTTMDLANTSLKTSNSDSTICSQTKTLIENKNGVCTYQVTVTGKKVGNATITFVCGTMKRTLQITVGSNQATTNLKDTDTIEATTQGTTTEKTTTEAPFLRVNVKNIEYEQYSGMQEGEITIDVPYDYVLLNAIDGPLTAARSNTAIITELEFTHNGTPVITGNTATYQLHYAVKTDIDYVDITPYIHISCGELTQQVFFQFTPPPLS